MIRTTFYNFHYEQLPPPLRTQKVNQTFIRRSIYVLCHLSQRGAAFKQSLMQILPWGLKNTLQCVKNVCISTFYGSYFSPHYFRKSQCSVQINTDTFHTVLKTAVPRSASE